jgi:hypothetical protein
LKKKMRRFAETPLRKNSKARSDPRLFVFPLASQSGLA